MADSKDAASGLIPRDGARVRRDTGVRAASRDVVPGGRRGVAPGERPDEVRRITPRSPRAALEPERVPMPTRRSERVRHPLVIAGNAVFTVLILIAIAGGILFVVAKQRFEAPGPLESEKIVNIPPRLGICDIADLLVTEGLTSDQIVQRHLETDILFGNIKEIPREGSMLPESYRYARGTSRDQVIQRMQQAQARIVQEVWDRRMSDLPLRSPQQLVILASI